jgi:predicted aldo/keto reductase-like oxidoreductase
MGVFIISPTDKGGHLYMPPKKMADACGTRHEGPELFPSLVPAND